MYYFQLNKIDSLIWSSGKHFYNQHVLYNGLRIIIIYLLKQKKL